MIDGPNLLEAMGIEKRFGATHALKSVDFSLARGEVHALVGANGAGKSTLSRVFAGMHRPDGGTLKIMGNEAAFGSPRDALTAGVAMVTQETSLAVHLTALENIFMPELGRPGRLNWRQLRARADELIAELKIDMQFSLDDRVESLSMANRQIVEILKVLALNSRIILLDEPTTSLSPYECDKLLELTQRLALRGHGLILVTHRMEEIFAATDRLSVLREGALVAAGVATASVNSDELIRLMVGKELRDVYAQRENPTEGFPKTALRVEGLKAGRMVRDVTFEVGVGEILGLGGLVGAGRTETVEAIFGLSALESGRVELFGREFKPSSPISSIRAGIGFVGEDRRRHGLVPDFSVRENLMLVHLSLQKKLGLTYKSVEREAHAVVEKLGLHVSRLEDANILKFSGGMQQKIIIARWLLAHPKLLILDEPTRGVDIETRASIYKALRELAAQGTAIIVVSSDFEELLGLSNRVVVLSDGRSVADVPSAYLDIERLTMLAAPRTSAGQVGELLGMLSDQFNATAVWFHRDEERIFCFDSAGEAKSGRGFKRGVSLAVAESPFAQNEGGNNAVVPLRGKRGQSMGFIGLVDVSSERLPSDTEFGDLIQTFLYPSESTAA